MNSMRCEGYTLYTCICAVMRDNSIEANRSSCVAAWRHVPNLKSLWRRSSWFSGLYCDELEGWDFLVVNIDKPF